MKSSMYDEEAAKSFDRHADMEYGITITKVRFKNSQKLLFHKICTGYRDQRGSADGDDSYTVTTIWK